MIARATKNQQILEEIRDARGNGAERAVAIREIMMRRMGKKKGRLNKCRG